MEGTVTPIGEMPVLTPQQEKRAVAELKVEVRPIKEKKWHGKVGKESFAQPKTREVLYDDKTGSYATGLTEAEAIEYGKKMGVDLSATWNANEPHPFWTSKAAWIVLPNHTLILDQAKPADFVKIKNMKASKYVANSLKEYDEGKWPDATHVIFDENEEVVRKASKVQARNEAIVWASKMTDDDKIAMVQILSNKRIKGKSTDYISVEVSEIIDAQPDEFLRYIKMGKEEVHLRALVYEGLMLNVLNKEGGSVYYMNELIGIDFDAAVNWFRNPSNVKLKVAILEKIESKKR